MPRRDRAMVCQEWQRCGNLLCQLHPYRTSCETRKHGKGKDILQHEKKLDNMEFNLRQIRNRYLRKYYESIGDYRGAYENLRSDAQMDDSLAHNRLNMRASEIMNRLRKIPFVYTIDWKWSIKCSCPKCQHHHGGRCVAGRGHHSDVCPSFHALSQAICTR